MEFFRTEPITVITCEHVFDDLGEVVSETEIETETDALICPVSTSDLTATRPNGDAVVYNVHFRKGWNSTLKGAKIRLRGEIYCVEGDPQPLTKENCPTPYNLKASVVKVDG